MSAKRWWAVALGVVVLAPARAGAWSAPTHVALARLPLRRLPPGLRQLGERHHEALEAGACAPDRRGGAGWIPAQAHVLEPRDQGGGGLMARSVASLEAWLRRRSPEEAEWWFQAGRLVHLVSDLMQPMHTARDPREKRLHAGYERWVARRTGDGLEALLSPTGAGPGGVAPRVARLEALALRQRRSYAWLLDAYARRERRPLVWERTKGWLDEAVEACAARLEAAARPVSPWRAGALWGYVVLLALGLQEWRLRALERVRRPADVVGDGVAS